MKTYERRVAGADWDAVTAEVNDLGCALLPPLLTPDEAAQIAGLYDEAGRFRATDPARARPGLHHPRSTGALVPRLVGGTRPARCVRDPLRTTPYPRVGLPRRYIASQMSQAACRRKAAVSSSSPFTGTSVPTGFSWNNAIRKTQAAR